MRRIEIEELVRETGPMVLLKDIKGWFEANTGKSRKSYYDCYKAAQIKIEKNHICLYILNGQNEHIEIVYPKRNVRVEQRAIPVLVLKGNPLIKREVESSSSAKVKNKHSNRILSQMELTASQAKSIQRGGLYTLPEVGIQYEKATRVTL